MHSEIQKHLKRIFHPYTEGGYQSVTYLIYSRYLHGNWITHIENDDFCNMTNLQNLYIGSNLLTEGNIDPDAFQCLQVLDLL